MCKKENSFAQWFVNEFGLEKFNTAINHEKNKSLGIDIWNISKRSSCKIWFKCENKDYHEYQLSADKYFIGNRCKYCGRTKYVHPKDSLGQYIIDNFGEDFLNKIWSTKNKKSPFEYTIGTEKKVWLNCINGIHEPKLRQVKNSVANDFKCPFCLKNCHISKLEEKVFLYLKGIFENVNRESNCTLIPKNPKTNMIMPYDNEIVEIKLIIEVHGKQHYELSGETSAWLHGLSPEEYLHKRRLYDRYKRIYAKSNGYYYLEIPYWTDDSEETWKSMIDKKIKEILSQ